MIYFLGMITIIANISNINLYLYDIKNGNKLMTPTIKLPEYEFVVNELDNSDNTRIDLWKEINIKIIN